MPRTYNLTWQPGIGGRSGRWRKKYRGEVYYFEGGRGKSDRQAYDAAVKQWELEKLRVDGSTPRLHQEEYEGEINTWEKVLAWSKRHGDTAMAQLAFEKIAGIRSQLETPLLRPLAKGDRFESQFRPVLIELPDDLLRTAAQTQLTNAERSKLASVSTSRETRERLSRELDGSSLRIEDEIWKDRLSSQEKRSAIQSNLIVDHIQNYVEQKEREAASGELSVGRAYAIRLHLSHFSDWIGTDTSVDEIDTQKLQDYHAKLLGMVPRKAQRSKTKATQKKERSWTPKTAREYLTTAKSFVRWLWEMELFPALPRVLGHKSNSLKITPENAAPVIFDDKEIRQLLDESRGRTKLFILLMLNCGMTQKDVADLRKSQIDFGAGRIIRKRSKTGMFDAVPTVNYLLWPETLKLLKEFVDHGEGELAMLNSNGTPLWSESLSNGKYHKSDNIKNAFDRLRKKLGITKPPKSLKKTSSSKIRDNERFNGLEDLFLGHAPQKMSDKHYASALQTLFDKAICWLAGQYGLTAPTG